MFIEIVDVKCLFYPNDTNVIVKRSAFMFCFFYLSGLHKHEKYTQKNIKKTQLLK